MSAPPALTQSHIARALEEMLSERHNLAARLEKIDALIAAMRDAFHLPDRRPRVNGHANGNGHGTVSEDAIRTALAAGPMSPGALANALGVKREVLRPQLARLEQQGLVVATGVTAGRRVALAPAKHSPAKEAP